MDIGMAFGGDPDLLLDWPSEKRVRAMSWALARKEKAASLWAVSPLQATDLVHLLSQVVGKGGKGGTDGALTGDDLMESLLGSLWAPGEGDEP